MGKIVPAFEATLFDPILSDSCIDMADLGIDSLLDDDLLKDIPIFFRSVQCRQSCIFN